MNKDTPAKKNIQCIQPSQLGSGSSGLLIVRMGFDEHEGGVRLTTSLNGLRAQALASGLHDDLSHLEA